MTEADLTPATESRLLALRALIPTALLFAFFYFCGLVFYEQMMTSWGFDPSLFPIDTQRVYVWSFSAWTTIVVVAANRPSPFALYLAAALIPLYLLRQIPFRRVWQQFRRTAFGRFFRAWGASVGERNWVNVLAWSVMGALGLTSIFLTAVLILYALLSRAATDNVEHAWATGEIHRWPQVTWAEPEIGS